MKMSCEKCIFHTKTDRCIRRDSRTAKKVLTQEITKDWTQCAQYKKHIIYDKDVGGGGDCLFYCFGEIYIQWYEHIVTKATPRQKELYTHILKNRLYFRELIARQLTPQFLKKVAHSLVAREKTLTKQEKKTFLDSFYTESGFWLKLGFDDNDADSLAQQSHSVENASKRAQQMKKRSSQWGGEFDIALFETMTRIGVWVISPSDDNKKLFYCTTFSKTFPYYAFIRNINLYHYTLAAIQNNRSSPLHTVWKTKTLPPWIVDKLNHDCPKKL
jgi:hypothetical protein